MLLSSDIRCTWRGLDHGVGCHLLHQLEHQQLGRAEADAHAGLAHMRGLVVGGAGLHAAVLIPGPRARRAGRRIRGSIHIFGWHYCSRTSLLLLLLLLLLHRWVHHEDAHNVPSV